MEMPDYLSDHKPGDTVPFELWQRACKIRTCPPNHGFSSDAIFLNLKPVKKGYAYINDLNKRLASIETQMEALRSEMVKAQHELKRATK